MSIFSSIAGAGASSISHGITQPFNRALGYAVNLALPLSIPPIEAMYDAFRSGLLDFGTLEMLASFLGISTRGWGVPVANDIGLLRPPGGNGGVGGAWAGMLDKRVQQVTMGDLCMLRLRGDLTEQDWVKRANEAGWWRSDYRDEIWKLASQQIPGAADLVRFALRDAWDQQAVQRWGYDQDFPDAFGDWMGAQGWNSDARTPAQKLVIQPVTWSQMYWRAHWSTLSPTQSYEMYQRLRSNRIGRYRAQIPDIKAFTYADLQSQLKINDYPPPVRPLLAAIAYRRPRLVDIDRFARTGAVDRREAFELHLDLGYAPADAQRRTDWLFSTAQQINPIAQAKSITRSILALYGQGEISRDNTLDSLTKYMTQSKWVSYDAMVAAATFDPSAAQAIKAVDTAIATADLQRQLFVAKTVTASWKRQYMSGMRTRIEITADMRTARRDQVWIDRTFVAWDAVLAGGRKMVSAAKIKRLVKERVIGTIAAKRYLQNLGYRDPELTWLLAEM